MAIVATAVCILFRGIPASYVTFITAASFSSLYLPPSYFL